ncbi:MAG: MBL fold metallo-hydrolase [Patescibacteria group bacterium]|jgi:glyoxylase-like metal-dependent hydrolase (beta-lactamase superfamily II)
MAKVKVLIEGYAKELENGWIASSTVCLVTTGDKRIITDPGCNREKLLEALKGENLATGDIDYVFLSHCHPDHVLLAGIFEKAKFVTFDSNLLYDKDHLSKFDIHILGEDIEIVETPGHVLEHLSLIVNTSQGRVAIAGDVIWWVDGEEQKFDIDQEDHSQAKGMNMKQLVESRRNLLEHADYIIPGHGKMFKVQK